MEIHPIKSWISLIVPLNNRLALVRGAEPDRAFLLSRVTIFLLDSQSTAEKLEMKEGRESGVWLCLKKGGVFILKKIEGNSSS